MGYQQCYRQACTQARGSPYLARRFQCGDVDEVSLSGPDLGPLCGLLVGASCGTWQPERVTITNSKHGDAQRFVLETYAGASCAPGAAYFKAVRPGHVPYGTGSHEQQITEVFPPPPASKLNTRDRIALSVQALE
jgi:hypothetical protein